MLEKSPSEFEVSKIPSQRLSRPRRLRALGQINIANR